MRKQSPDVLMYFAVHSPDDTYDRLFIVNYAYVYIVDQLKRAKGVGDVRVFGSEFGMRIWLRPDRMASLKITAADVARAIREQNVQAPAGQIGQPPSAPGQNFQYSLRVRGRLVDASEFADIIVGSKPDGSFVRLRDIGRVELGARDYNFTGQLDGHPSAVMAIFLVPGANALETAELVKAQLAQIEAGFPKGLALQIMYDTSEFVKASIEEVIHTFVEALILVLIVVFLFLQSWRATLIPMLAVPVSLVATFAAFEFLGFSINTLSLFGMVLAIGIVVDDAIVVVEAVEHNMQAQGLSPPRSDAQGDGRRAGSGGCDRAGARGGVHPDGLHPRRDRSALQAVRDYGRRVDHVLGARRAYAHTGALRDAPQTACARRAPRRAAGGFLRMVQPHLRSHQRSLRTDRGTRGAPRARRARDPRRGDPRDRRPAAHHTHRLRP